MNSVRFWETDMLQSIKTACAMNSQIFDGYVSSKFWVKGKVDHVRHRGAFIRIGVLGRRSAHMAYTPIAIEDFGLEWPRKFFSVKVADDFF